MGKYIVIILCFFSWHYHAVAQLRLDINQGNVEAISIAIPTITGNNQEAKEYGFNLSDIVENNLISSGLFRLVRRDSYLQESAEVDISPKFQDWRIINSQFLLLATTEVKGDVITIKSRLWDVFKQKQVLGKLYSTKISNWRRIGHKLADDIYSRLTGEGKYFESRIVYISESGPKDKRIKRLAIMDQDGANHRYLTDGSYLVLTPRFSPTEQKITFLSYIRGKPQVFLFNLETGENTRLGAFNNMTFAPRFSPDGKKIVMSYEQGGNSEVFLMDLRNLNTKRLTNHSSIDTSPSMSPDENHIVFNSDRGGSPQLYTMTKNGESTKRISFGKGRYSTPVWSPRGDLIAFTKQHSGQFYIGVMEPDGANERVLSQGYLVEAPSWSPNGRVLIFFKKSEKGGKTELYSVDLTGNYLKKIVTPQEASDPSWSPLLVN